MGIYRAYAVHSIEGNGTTFAIHSITDGVDECAVVEGSMPSRPDEIAINSEYASNNGIHVGDYIVFDHDATDDDPDGMAYLTTDRFKVTATITSPLYLIQLGGTLGITSSGGSIGGFAFVQDAAFAPAAFLDMHPGALVRASSDPTMAFLRLWTRKEAVLKCRGTGIRGFSSMQSALAAADCQILDIDCASPDVVASLAQ